MSRRNKNAKEYMRNMRELKGTTMTVRVSMSEYHNACEDMQGWCTTCKAFTRDSTEPDAEGYDCPDCDENTVEGAENALVNGDIEPCEDTDE